MPRFRSSSRPGRRQRPFVEAQDGGDVGGRRRRRPGVVTPDHRTAPRHIRQGWELVTSSVGCAGVAAQVPASQALLGEGDGHDLGVGRRQAQRLDAVDAGGQQPAAVGGEDRGGERPAARVLHVPPRQPDDPAHALFGIGDDDTPGRTSCPRARRAGSAGRRESGSFSVSWDFHYSGRVRSSDASTVDRPVPVLDKAARVP